MNICMIDKIVVISRKMKNVMTISQDISTIRVCIRLKGNVKGGWYEVRMDSYGEKIIAARLKGVA